ncbi:PAQR family membrane homeostasis protein TrhA [Patulibacter defluvii]|uniref:PAQR family membrane homeostasis protein TrhA n=1 Tax=Patulibacter defluvii TaxID=3095358 RepID=UPI002A7589AA|nr:hemolysin III family protein [Patulibacter sp. DM4]
MVKAPSPLTLPTPVLKPRMRGVLHQWAAVVAAFAGAFLVLSAPNANARLASLVYAVSIVGLFTVSAIYHRVNWRRPNARAWMRRLDHSMIFVMVAGSVTPIAAIVLEGPLRTTVLSVAWGLAGVGITIKLLWIGAPKWVSAAIYLGIGWAGMALFPKLVGDLGPWPAVGLIGGGLLYTAGAIIYAGKRPDPFPRVFGYHEIFHALVIVAALAHYLVVALAVVPHA